MKKLLLALLIFGLQQLVIAQSPDTVFVKQDTHYDDTLIYSTDTIIFPNGMVKHMLIGTTVLPNTNNQMVARNFGIWSTAVSKSDCVDNPDHHEKAIQRINSVVNTDSTLIVDITIAENCCFDFLCDISIDSTGMLNLLYYGYGTYCACNCCFGLTYTLTKYDLGDWQKKEVKEVMINGDRKTLKAVK